MLHFLENWKKTIRKLKVELYALYLAYKDPRVPLYTRIFAACVVGYALSPIDLIPDFIPVIGYLDDLLIVPAGIWLSLKMIPAAVMVESREKAQELMQQNLPVNRFVAGLIIIIWLILAILAIAFVVHILKNQGITPSQQIFGGRYAQRPP
jgi:uncharacterized membrane protein YkvA (DUF1232 family)